MTDYVEKVMEKVKETLEKQPDQSVAHRFDHLDRVRKRAIFLTKLIKEGQKEIEIDLEILQIAALLHDIEQPYNKRKKDHVEMSIRKAMNILKELDYPKRHRVLKVIAEHSLEDPKKSTSIEAKILFDADKLDGFGYIGMARVFAYGGQQGMSLEKTIKWYREEIKKAKGQMRTIEAKRLCAESEKSVSDFLENIEKEKEFLERIDIFLS